MDTFKTDRIRNIALVGHSGEGKTSIAECILYNAKSTDRIGKTSNGTTVMDFDEQEIARQISVSLSVAYAVWKDVKLNLIDVPGFPDFEGELKQGSRVLSRSALKRRSTTASNTAFRPFCSSTAQIKRMQIIRVPFRL